MNRCAVATACSSDTSYEPNGRSATSSGVLSPRRTAAVSMSISSTVTGTVLSYPRTVIAAESPTSTMSTPAASAICALG